MTKPRILVMTAAGNTGLPIALQLLSEGFPITAFVRREDQRSERLKAKGAHIVAGSITDLVDIRRAMAGVQRAYFNTPLEQGHLKAASTFATAAAEHKLESLVVMSQWLSNPLHPSEHTRETWLAEKLLALLPGTAMTILNPGFFANNEMQLLPYIAQFGLFLMPYGAGLNAPPSNEDIAAVAAEVLARPAGHAGKVYRPTGPKLLSPQEIAATFTKVLGHKITYINVPVWILAKVMKGMGYSNYAIAQFQQYALDYQQNAFAVNAPTDVVLQITGKEPEDYETIVRRYASSMPGSTRNIGTQLKLMTLMSSWMLRPGPKTDQYLSRTDISDQQHISLSADSPEWTQTHTSQWVEA